MNGFKQLMNWCYRLLALNGHAPRVTVVVIAFTALPVAIRMLQLQLRSENKALGYFHTPHWAAAIT